MKSLHTRALKLASFCLLIGCVGVVTALAGGSEGASRPSVHVVVVGGTGDLATRYLWQGFFSLYQEQREDYAFSFVGAARMPATEGDGQLATILQNNVSCEKSLHPDPDCPAVLKDYKALVSYRKLKTAEDYAKLCSQMSKEGQVEHGRLFYLSVPPFAYAGIAENIAKGCRPDGSAWLRVVLEKPFGRDYDSAQELALRLAGHLREEEVYRIDHYLGKAGVQSILPFRSENRDVYEKLWNAEHIERVEIVMKETLDCKGRLAFYDEYGVIRDVVQNHLTEIFALVAMEIPPVGVDDRHAFLANKMAVLNRTGPVGPQWAVTGQYRGYNEQRRAEMGQGSSGEEEEEESLVPTFVAASLAVATPRWQGVPFVLVAGKRLDERLGYVRVLFKRDVVCLAGAGGGGGGGGSRCSRPRQIVFVTGNPGSRYPTVLVSRGGLPAPRVPADWTVVADADADPSAEFLGEKLADFHRLSPPRAGRDAYTSLIASCFGGERRAFVGTADLMASWRIWTPLLRSLSSTRPRVYPDLDEAGAESSLDFRVGARGLSFVSRPAEPVRIDAADQVKFAASRFRSRPLVTGDGDLVVAELAEALLRAATDAVRRRGSFHLALPGGSTPRALFARLARQAPGRFPWADTHVWLTDERCVPAGDPESNFGRLHDMLLRYVDVPYFNLHPMPVRLARGLCETEDGGAGLYQADLARLPDRRLDFVVLGVGGDGHVASLFPGRPASLGEATPADVLVTDAGPQPTPRRMSLTLPAINRSRRVAVLILGRGKRSLVSALGPEEVGDGRRYPVLAVSPTDGEMVWYIDHEALM